MQVMDKLRAPVTLPLMLAVLALCALVAGVVERPVPRLVWNASASVPVGLYRIEPGRIPEPRELALAWLPPDARELAQARNYLPKEVPIIKPVAAAGGDEVCASGAFVRVGGRIVARRLANDAAGRALPSWYGCRVLADAEVLLLARAKGSFDGRYFGPTPTSEIIGTAWRLWPS